MRRDLTYLNEWFGRLPSARRAGVVLLVVFVPLLILFVATGEQIGSAVAQAAFWAILGVVAAVGGRALGTRRRGGSGPGPQ
jgi:hypothetical protein